MQMAETRARRWEKEIRAEHQNATVTLQETEEKKKTDFASFVNDVWFQIHVRGQTLKPKTEQFYEHCTKNITEFFKGKALQDLSPLDIEKYLAYLRTEFKTKQGKNLAPKTVYSYYRTLHLIFAFAERQDLIQKNPMNRVKAPKKVRKPVEAMNQEQAKAFLAALDGSPLEFKCMMYLLITTGIRRGECTGLKWKDINESEGTLHTKRTVAYTAKSGIVNSTFYQINFRSYTGPLSSQQEQVIKSVVDSVTFKEIQNPPEPISYSDQALDDSEDYSGYSESSWYKGLVAGIVALLAAIIYNIFHASKKKQVKEADNKKEQASSDSINYSNPSTESTFESTKPDLSQTNTEDTNGREESPDFVSDMTLKSAEKATEKTAASDTKKEPQRYCHMCGSLLLEGSVFCSKCGTKVWTGDIE